MTSASVTPFNFVKSVGSGALGALAGLLIAVACYVAVLFVPTVALFFASPFIGGPDASGEIVGKFSQFISPAYFVLVPAGVVIGFIRGFAKPR